MKTLTSNVNTEKAAAQSGWTELYDIYLPSAIATPWGSISTLRLTKLPGGYAFFTPKVWPEPSGTQGNAQTYNEWTIKRGLIRSDGKLNNDKITIVASNVTSEWAAMLDAINWEGIPVIIRMVPTSANSGAPTADDCALIFTGRVEKPGPITEETIQFTLSNEMVDFSTVIPAGGEIMHSLCRFKWGDDLCTAIRHRRSNYKDKTCGSSSTTTLVKSADLTEDTGASSLGTDYVDGLADGAFTASSENAGQEGYKVRSVTAGLWALPNTNDWGNITEGYWQIPDAQAGLKNPALKPNLTIDFGSARALCLWGFMGNASGGKDLLPRMLEIFSSPDNTNWTFQCYFECPMRVNEIFYCYIHAAPSVRYWRICVRSRWGSVKGISMFEFVRAYEGCRNYWADGMITFKSDTSTVALRGVSAKVLSSYAGELVTTPLPVAPANGDTFWVERGCPRTFNACAERLNTEHFGGFSTMPFETVVRL